MIAAAVPMRAAEVEPAPYRRRKQKSAAVRHETREITAAQFGRICALTSYGMTRAQVAELYGVTVEAIDHIVGHPTSRRKS